MFIDETWIKTNMAPIRGWGPRNARLVGFAPDGRWHTLTFLAALRLNALTAPCVVDGPINGTIFRAYVEQFLLPTLRPGDMSSSTTWEATAPGRSALRSATPAPNSRSSRPIRPISIRLSRCSQR